MDRLLKSIAFWTLIIPPGLMDSIRFTDALRAGRIARVTLPSDATIGGDLAQSGPEGKPARFLIATPAYRDLLDDLLRHNVALEFHSPRESSMLLLIGVWIYFMRTMQAARRNTLKG